MTTPSDPNAVALLSGQQQPEAAAQESTPAPQANASQPTPAPQANPAMAAQTAQAQHHTLLGRLAENLLVGGQTQYAADPNTGQVVAQTVKPKPGQLFSSIVRGALLGAAAGQGTPDFATGFARGAGAQITQQQGQDQQNYQRAQQAVANAHAQSSARRANQAANDEHLLRQYTLAKSDLEDYKLARDLDTHAPDIIDRANAAYDARLSAAEESGGHDADIQVGDWKNGVEGNAETFTQAYAADPKAFQPPEGYEYVKALSVDTSGLHYDQHRDPATHQVISRWLDKAGNPVNVETRTAVHIMAVPISAFKELRPYSGAELNKINPKANLDPSGTYPLTLEQHNGLTQDAIKDANDATRARAAEEAARNRQNQNSPQTIDDLAQDLVDGRLDPSQLSKRTENYNAVLSAADDYSRKTYGAPFDIAGAQRDYRFATNPGTQNTLKYLNSVIPNMAELVRQSSALGRTQFPALNRPDLWAKLQAGNTGVASYHAAISEVADQVAKIMQGGGTGSDTSDAKLKQVQELFDKGFSARQIASVAGTLGTLLGNRKAALIGNNRYLQRQFGSRASSVPAAVQNVLSGAGPGRHTLSDGSVWDKAADGSITQVKGAR